MPLARALLDLLLPRACAGCGRGVDAGPLCRRCLRALPALPEPEPPAPPPLAAWAAAAPYEGGWDRWVQRFKYPGPGLAALDPAADAVLADLARRAAGRAAVARPGRIAAVVPVPDHPERLRARGFHPAGVLAATVARRFRRPLDATALVRLRPTPSQTGLSRAARARNVAGAFAAARPLAGRVWLVDDVATSGATLAAAARAARSAGAREVVGVTAVRALDPAAIVLAETHGRV